MKRIKKIASELKNKLGKSEVEKLTLFVIKGNEIILKSTYYSIADMTNCQENNKRIAKIIWDNLNFQEKNTQKISKTLEFIETMIKLSSLAFIIEVKSGINKIRNYLNYYIEGKGLENGLYIRELARNILYLLNNEKALEEARELASKQREHSAGFSSDQYGNQNIVKKYGDSEENGKEYIKGYKPPTPYGKNNIDLDSDQVSSLSIHSIDIKEKSAEKPKISSNNNKKTVNLFEGDIFSGLKLKKTNQEYKTSNPTKEIQEENLRKNEDHEKKIDIFSQAISLDTSESGKNHSLAQKPKNKQVLKGLQQDNVINIFNTTNNERIELQSKPLSYNPMLQQGKPLKKDLFNFSTNSNTLQYSTPAIDRLFGLPLKSSQNKNNSPQSSILSNSSNIFDQIINLDIDSFDILSLNIKSETQNDLKGKNKDILFEKNEKIIKTIENSNVFSNVQTGVINNGFSFMKKCNPIIINSIGQDLIDFEKYFPSIYPITKLDPQNLEASLMNVAELESSLEKSVGPRILARIEL